MWRYEMDDIGLGHHEDKTTNGAVCYANMQHNCWVGTRLLRKHDFQIKIVALAGAKSAPELRFIYSAIFLSEVKIQFYFQRDGNIKPTARAVLACIVFTVAPSTNASTATSTFQVLITIAKACTVTAGPSSNINLGSVNSSATNTTGNSTIYVNCSKTTPYFIGLAPSTANGGSTTGAGAMSSVANSSTNTDKVP